MSKEIDFSEVCICDKGNSLFNKQYHNKECKSCGRLIIYKDNPALSAEDVIKLLWRIIDEIDSSSDLAKGNDPLYRNLVYSEQKKRFNLPITLKDDEELDFSNIDFNVVNDLHPKLLNYFSDYVKSEGCECCRDKKGHEIAEENIAKILNPSMYKDGSGYNWFSHCSDEENIE